MALKKQIENEKGVRTTYHRIDGIAMENGLRVTVKSYTDESYRQQEKEVLAQMEQQEKIKEELQLEMEKTGADYQREKVIALTEQNNALGFPVMPDLAVFTRTFCYPLDKGADFSYQAIYSRLKQEAVFAYAEDK